MSMLRIVTLAALVAVSAGSPSTAQDKAPDAAEYSRRAVAAYKAKDYAAFLENMQRANELRPNHPRLIYNLASASALNGKTAEAVALLERVADMGLVYPASEDEDFAAIRETEPFKAIIARFKANAAPVSHAEVALSLPLRGFIMEGVAYDPVDRAYYATSVRERRIVRVDRSGAIKDFAAKRDDLWSALGVHVDAKRRLLWVATTAMEYTGGIDAKDDGRSGLLAFDLATGKVVRSAMLANASEKHGLGDLAIAPDGTIFATDSKSPALYALRAGSSALERVGADIPFVSPQGLAFSVDGKRLYVADYARGVFVVDPVTGTWSPLEASGSICLLGIDGLYVAGDSLVAIQNGVNPQRVVRVGLDRTGRRAERLEVLEQNSTHLEEPTLGAIVDGWFYFVGNSQWNRFDEKHNLPPASELKDHVILRLKL